MSQEKSNPSSGLSRRKFLGVSTAAGLGLIAASMPRVALARRKSGVNRDVLVSIFLRGGADAICLVAPYGDPAYAAARPTQRVLPPSSGGPQAGIDLNGYFALHPALAPILPAYLADDLLIVHAVGSPHMSRSHFEKERIVETADESGASPTGWIGRHLASIGAASPGALCRGIGVRHDLAYSMMGAPKTLPISSIENFGLYGSGSTQAARMAVLNTMYSRQAEPVRSRALDSLATISLLQTINFAGYQPQGGAVYPTTGAYAAFGQAMKSTAALIKAQIGVEAIAIDLDGWDTHGTQGTFGGTFAGLATALGQALGAFYTDMTQGGAPTVTVVVMTEFGRRIAENGSAGTDHGHGGAMFLLGNGSIAGGSVLTSWPGLAPAQRFEGLDLAVTIDHRDILAEIAQTRLQNPSAAALFPNFTPTFRGVANP